MNCLLETLRGTKASDFDVSTRQQDEERIKAWAADDEGPLPYEINSTGVRLPEEIEAGLSDDIPTRVR